MTKIAAVLLAAGLSERMGGPNKMLLDINDFKVIELTHARLVRSDIDSLTIVTGRDREAVQKLFPNDTDTVFNADFARGMTSSIQAGVNYADAQSAYMICLGDMPWVDTIDYNQLLQVARAALTNDEKAIVMPVVNGLRGNPVIFSNHYRAEILAYDEPNGCKGIVRRHQQHLVEFETNSQAFIKDIDQPEDLPDRL